MSAQPQTITTNVTTGIATIKPKRKYTKRKAKIKLVKPTVRKGLPKTASAYLRTLGMAVDKESAAVSELIRLHSELNKSSQKPAFANPDLSAPEPAEGGSLWDRFKGWLSK